MYLSEISGNIAKIGYDEDNLSVFDSIYIGDINFSLTGQVCEAEFNEVENKGSANVKICFMTDENGDITEYDGSVPTEHAVIRKMNTADIMGLLKPDDTPGVFIGNSLNDDTPVIVDKDLFDENVAIFVDNAVPKFVSNLINSFKDVGKKELFIDFSGNYRNIGELVEKRTVGKDFSLPLNEAAFKYILENETNECDEECKNQLSEIITELMNYVVSIPEKFIPFDIFKSIIDEKVATEANEGLLFFADKLNDYEVNKVFANSKDEFNFINDADCGIIDACETDIKLCKPILKSICEQIEENTVIFCDVNDENIDEDLIKEIYSNEHITFVPLIPYGNKYASEFDLYTKSKIMFSPENSEFIPKGDEGFFNALSGEDFVLTGENLLSFVFGAYVSKSDDKISEEEINEEEIVEARSEEEKITEEDLDNIDMFVTGSSKEYSVKEDLTEETSNDEEISENEDNDYSKEDITEKAPEDFERKITERVIETEIYRPIRRDPPVEAQPQTVTYKAALSDLPVYEAKQPDTEEEEFKPGMKVSHAKYGTGTVEKVIAYGKKTLCSIQFEHIGRRLLDPKVTPLERV